jgi:hypothetical protein
MTIAVFFGELAIRLGVAFLEPFAIVIADKAALSDDRIEPAMRKGVPPTRDQSVVEALPLFESLPTVVLPIIALSAIVLPAVAVTVAPSVVLGENA